jgi:hypothetical protein
MGVFGGWFKKKEPEDYEQILASLALDIQKRQTRLSEIRLRERRTTLLFSVYALALWVAYLSLWYTDLVPTLSNHPRYSKFEKSVEAAPVFLGPILILCIRRIVQIWYTRIGDAEEKSLVVARKRQREKIEEIKKKTNYYSTRTLIERYDEGTVSETPLRKRVMSQPASVATPRSQQPPPQVQSSQRPVPFPQTPTPLSPALKQHLSPSPQRPMSPPRKQWYDRVADVILGDDDSATNSASRYALICQKCFAHNGLVKESVWEDTQYVCPKCGYFNPSARSQRAARSSASPSPSRGGLSQERSRSRPRPDGAVEVADGGAEGNGATGMDVDS